MKLKTTMTAIWEDDYEIDTESVEEILDEYRQLVKDDPLLFLSLANIDVKVEEIK